MRRAQRKREREEAKERQTEREKEKERERRETQRQTDLNSQIGLEPRCPGKSRASRHLITTQQFIFVFVFVESVSCAARAYDACNDEQRDVREGIVWLKGQICNVCVRMFACVRIYSYIYI